MLKHSIKRALGNTLIFFNPQKARLLAQEGMTLDMGIHFSTADRLMRYAMIQNSVRSGDVDRLVEYHQNYWSQRGDEYYEAGLEQNHFEEIFLPKYGGLIQELGQRIDPEKYHTLVEIGVGSGEVLKHLAEQIPSITNFVGLDLNEAQIRKNRDQFANDSRFKFYAADANQWIPQNAKPGTVFVTSRGVLEYFTTDQLGFLFQTIAATCAPAIFLAIEPIRPDHDMATEFESSFYGLEYSFSHNYPHLFQTSDFNLWHQHIEPIDPLHSLISIGAETKQ